MWLEVLKAKAGRRCYRCLAAGHRIADCRDPPRCILCFRFGHKARLCPHPPVTARPPPFQAPARSTAYATAPPLQTSTRSAAQAPPLQAGSAAHAPPFKPPLAAAALADTAVRRSSPAAAAAAAPNPFAGMNYAHWTPAAPEQRPAHTYAGVTRSDAIRRAERELEIFSLIAIQIDASARLDTRLVMQEAVHQLNVSSVSKLSTATYLLNFNSQQLRNAAYQCRSLHIGHLTLTLMPWKRQVSANAMLSKYNYQVRLCIEGVPSHLRHAEAVAGLFKPPAFIDTADCPKEKPQEEECLRLWLWTSDPDGIATTGTLQAEEPVTPPDGYYPDDLTDQDYPGAVLRCGPAQTMDYKVFVHVDRVLDYTPQPASPTHRSIESPISGHPDEDMEDKYPVKYLFQWTLGVPDGGHRVPEQRRVSVHDRLGDRNRDRSPPRGGGGTAGGIGNGLGLRQFPPSGRYDVGGPSGFGSCNYHTGGQFRGRQLDSSQMQQKKWKVKRDGRTLATPKDNVDMLQFQGEVAGIAASYVESIALTDPMIDEANLGVTEERNLAQLANLKSTVPTDELPIPEECMDVSARPSETVQALDGLGDVQVQLQHALSACEAPSPILTSSDGVGTMFAGLFDLNEDAPIVDEATELHGDGAVLKDATDRLNTETKEYNGHRPGTRGLSRFAIPLRKALLCPPAHKTKTPKLKRHVTQDVLPTTSGNKSAHVAGVHEHASIDEQATAFLMKTAGILVGDETMTVEAQQRFGNSFVMPLQFDKVADMRIAFDLPAEGNADKLSSLVGEDFTDDV
ncbi:unnamed protein product [Urochloa decumbens]|uniref:CCHC-type domain-containing protein n=1 Tax=Urochloa decumbens TaxID=240449 RepID=A0ABC9CXZ8_9POAL